MPSDTEICNLALAALGISQTISPLTEASTEAGQCNLFFAQTRDMVLRDFDWPFARQYVALGLVTEAPNTDWNYAYRYPSGCLAVRRIVGAARTETRRIPFVIGSDGTGRLIYTDELGATACITARIENSEFFDPVFVSAFANRLASRIGVPLSRDPKLIDRAYQMYLVDLAAARADAANEAGQDAPPDAESISARA